MLVPASTVDGMRAAFRWDIPERYNIGVDICDRLAARDPDALAIVDVAADGTVTETDFGTLRALSNRLASALARRIGRGDRVAVFLPQRLETAVAHIAILKLGAISLPLFKQFGAEALRHRLVDAGARLVITDAQGAGALSKLRDDLPDLDWIVSVNGGGDADFSELLAAGEVEFTPVDTAAEDPAILIYTSGTTGPPKGALHAHRVLLGHLPGVEMSHDFLPQTGDRIWTPADWAWIGGLLDVLMPALHHGVPVVAHRFERFTGEAAFAFIRRHGIRNVFLPPTALKMMRQVADPGPVALRSVASGGETLGAELIAWAREVLGVTINEFYGQTECNMIVSSCAAVAEAAPGVMGFPVPGHDVAVIDPATGQTCAEGVEGAIAVRAPDPVMFLRYWNRPEATEDKFLKRSDGSWLLTGDQGCTTKDGRIRFIARDDDVISSSGYRIGPGEIEDCLIGHPKVQMAGVVAAPDQLRGAVVAAFVVLHADVVADEALVKDLQAHVAARLAPYEVPKIVRFVSDLPLTTTGKIVRADLRKALDEA